ncbi:hypothetical protein B0H15DRAFT_807345 [Mycena belliarum]|uniref:Uncharacterized protein n=1 Tax=Mycena belliarum TaxID=1033014 RepID=A0AAD6XKZ4_9AGAR|nr:hypothetical protein B0H15DRAFT_807345 [Mycena belliae]
MPMIEAASPSGTFPMHDCSPAKDLCRAADLRIDPLVGCVLGISSLDAQEMFKRVLTDSGGPLDIPISAVDIGPCTFAVLSNFDADGVPDAPTAAMEGGHTRRSPDEDLVPTSAYDTDVGTNADSVDVADMARGDKEAQGAQPHADPTDPSPVGPIAAEANHKRTDCHHEKGFEELNWVAHLQNALECASSDAGLRYQRVRLQCSKA